MLPLLSFVCAQALKYPVQALDLSMMTSGWGVPKVNLSIQGLPLTIHGKKYQKGIGTHAKSRLNLKLNKAVAFTSVVGVDDETQGKGAVEFIVIVDGSVKWRSGKMSGGDSAKKVQVDLSGASILSLVVTDAGTGLGYGHADWIDPTVTTLGEVPVPVRDAKPIRIETAHAALQMYVADGDRLFQRAFGGKSTQSDSSYVAYPCAGDGWIDAIPQTPGGCAGLVEDGARVLPADGPRAADAADDDPVGPPPAITNHRSHAMRRAHRASGPPRSL